MSRAGRVEVSLRHVLLPVGLALAVVLRWTFGWGKGATFSVAVFFVGLSFLLGPLVARSKRSFDRALLRALQRGVRPALWRLYQRAWLLRALADRRYLAAKRALIHTELGEPAAALDAFRRALVDAPANERALLETGLANALYALGRDDEAGRSYRKLLAEGVDVPLVYHNLAHCILRQGGKPREAAKLLEKGLETAGAGPVAAPLWVTLAEALTELDDLAKARALLRDARAASLTGSGTAQRPVAARRALVEGKVEARGGDLLAAKECFARAVALDPDGETGREARRLLGDVAV